MLFSASAALTRSSKQPKAERRELVVHSSMDKVQTSPSGAELASEPDS